MENQERQKKKYTKPEVQHVDLRPEEAVLGACKLQGVSGPNSIGNCAPAGACVGQST